MSCRILVPRPGIEPVPPAVEDLTTGLLGKSLAACFFVSAFLFVCFWRHWVFVAVCGLSLVAASGGYSLLRCAGFSLQWLLLLQSMGSRGKGFNGCSTGLTSCSTWASVVVAHGFSCSVACGIFPDQGSNPCPLHWQADS